MITWLHTLPCFVVPFMFTLNVDGLGLLLEGPWGNMVWTNLTAILAVIAIGAGVGGWLWTRVLMAERVALVVASTLMLYPSWIGHVGGFVIFAAAGLILKRRSLAKAAEGNSAQELPGTASAELAQSASTAPTAN